MSVHLSKTCLMRLKCQEAKLIVDLVDEGDDGEEVRLSRTKEGGKICQLAARLLVCLSAAAQCVPYSSVLQSFVR